MSRRQTGPHEHARALEVLALAAGIGLVWAALELALTLVTGRVLFPAQLCQRLGTLLPWQVGLFTGIGAAVALLARWPGLSRRAAVGWILCAGSFALAGEALAEGLLRRRGPGAAAVALVLLGVGLAACTGLCLRLAVRLPGSWARAFATAAASGWTLWFLLWLQHSSAGIRLWEGGARALLAYLEPGHLLLAAGVAALLGFASLLPRAGRIAAAVLSASLVGLSPAVLAPPVPAAPAAPTQVRRPDVLLILVDTWRFDHLGANVGKAGLTPALDALARESILFTRTISPGNYTKLAVPGIHASLPFRVAPRPLPEAVTTLAEHLKRAGWATYGLSANPHVARPTGFAQGFDVFLDPTTVNEFLVEGLVEAVGLAFPGPAYRSGLASSALYYTPASVVRGRALDFFAASPGPTFVYLHTMDPHGPYLPPHRYLPEDFDYGAFESYHAFDHLKGRGILGQAAYRPRLENLRQRYRGGVRFTDDELGELVRQLQARGRWEETLVIVLSDHGEAFGEKDWAGHSGNNVSRTLVQVPFLVKPPRSHGISGRSEDSLVSTYDVLPTTLSLLGLPPADQAFGRDLSDLIRAGARPDARTVVSFAHGEGSDVYTALRWPWKLDLELDRRTSERRAGALYHLERDPEELSDVAAQHAEVEAELALALRVWRSREDQAALGTQAGSLDPLLAEQLRKLGYAE